MKTEDLNFTVDELNELCRLYMDCKLSVLQEKELEYVLSATSLTSPAIEEVRSLIGIQAYKQPVQARRKRSFNWRTFSGIAASVAIIVSAVIYSTTGIEKQSSPYSDDIYIAAYSHGQALSGHDAQAATNEAMAKADSLMNFAFLTEREYMTKADDVISETFNN